MTGFFLLSDKIATGSFDKTCKLWSTETGKCYHTFRGHSAEIVSTDGCFLFLYVSSRHHWWLCIPSPCELTLEGAAILLHLFIHSDTVNISALQEKIVWRFLRNRIKHCIQFEIFLFLFCSNFTCLLNVKTFLKHTITIGIFNLLHIFIPWFVYIFFFLYVLHCLSFAELNTQEQHCLYCFLSIWDLYFMYGTKWSHRRMNFWNFKCIDWV